MMPLRIALVSEHASPLAVLGGVDAGGQNVHVASLALALGARGHAVTVHTRRDDPLLPPVVALAPRVSVHHVDAGPPEAVPKDDLFPHMDRFAEVLCDEWRRCRPDIVHSHFWMSGYAASVAARALDLPHVHTFHALGVVKRRHQPEKDTSPPERISEEARLLHRCDRIIATCADEVFELRRLGASAEAATIVPCGVDPRHFTPEGPIEQRTPHRARIVSVGRLVERKGVGNVIDALVGLPNTELVVAGGPPGPELDGDIDIQRLRAVADRAGVSSRVDFRGAVPRSELPALLRSADIVACVPWYEPFGIVPLEAMACGVPVVASAVGGLTDSVVDGLTGRHVPPRDVPALTRTLGRLLAAPDERARMGRAGVQRVRQRFAWSRVAAATDDVYRSVLAGRGERRLLRQSAREEVSS